MRLRDYYPKDVEQFKVPRSNQLKLLDEIDDFIKKGVKTIIVQGPTGLGKSAVAVTLCRAHKYGYICTATKILQNQYINDFKEISIIYGRNNHICKEDEIETCKYGYCTRDDKNECYRKPVKSIYNLNGENEQEYIATKNVSRGPLFWNPCCDFEDRCNYWSAKIAALNTQTVTSNYDYLLNEANYSGDFGKRDILISDEGHELESKIRDFVKISVTKFSLNKITKYTKESIKFIQTQKNDTQLDKFKKHVEWLDNIGNIINACLESITKRKESTKDQDEFKKLQDDEEELSTLLKRMDKYIDDLKDLSCGWVVKEEREHGEITKLEFIPKSVDKYAYPEYLRLGDINIIMSATVLDPVRFTKYLGIEEYKYINVDSTFPTENNKVVNLELSDMRYIDNEIYREKYYKVLTNRIIDPILSVHSNVKGIIHCQSYQIGEIIKKYSKYSERIKSHTKENRDNILKEHCESLEEPTVLCSPSMYEGVDLKDDRSRFQIIVKVPYPSMDDERIKAMNPREKSEYLDYKAAISTVQAIGRSIRSEKDYATTYTIDSKFKQLFNKDIMKPYNKYIRPQSEFRDLINYYYPEYIDKLSVKIPSYPKPISKDANKNKLAVKQWCDELDKLDENKTTTETRLKHECKSTKL